jgi:hypothetical protein
MASAVRLLMSAGIAVIGLGSGSVRHLYECGEFPDVCEECYKEGTPDCILAQIADGLGARPQPTLVPMLVDPPLGDTDFDIPPELFCKDDSLDALIAWVRAGGHDSMGNSSALAHLCADEMVLRAWP